MWFIVVTGMFVLVAGRYNNSCDNVREKVSSWIHIIVPGVLCFMEKFILH